MNSHHHNLLPRLENALAFAEEQLREADRSSSGFLSHVYRKGPLGNTVAKPDNWCEGFLPGIL
jgi:hypothetical protein